MDSSRILLTSLPIYKQSLPFAQVYLFVVPTKTATITIPFMGNAEFTVLDNATAVSAQSFIASSYPGSTVEWMPGGKNLIYIYVALPPSTIPFIFYVDDSVGGSPVNLPGTFTGRTVAISGSTTTYYVESNRPFVPLVFRTTINWSRTAIDASMPPVTYGFNAGGNHPDTIQAVTFKDYDYNGAFAETGTYNGNPFYHPVVPLADFRYFSPDMRLRSGIHYLAVTADFATYFGLGTNAGGIGAECLAVQFLEN